MCRIGYRILVFCAILNLGACGGNSPGMDLEYDRTDVIGCYKAAKFPESPLRVSDKSLYFGDELVYNRYQYGLDGKAITPFMYVWPRIVGVEKGGRLAFGAYRGGEGSLTAIVEERNGLPAISFLTFEDDEMTVPNVVWFYHTPC